MNRSSKLIALLLLASFLTLSCDDRSSLEKVTKHVDTIISRVDANNMMPLEGIRENSRELKIHYFDINGDGKKDVIALFTISGGNNNYHSYMSTLLRKDNSFIEVKTIQIGGKGMRNIDLESLRIEKEVIVIQSFEYAPGDPLCCPSLAGEAHFSVSERGIKEVVNLPLQKRP